MVGGIFHLQKRDWDADGDAWSLGAAVGRPDDLAVSLPIHARDLLPPTRLFPSFFRHFAVSEVRACHLLG